MSGNVKYKLNIKSKFQQHILNICMSNNDNVLVPVVSILDSAVTVSAAAVGTSKSTGEY